MRAVLPDENRIGRLRATFLGQSPRLPSLLDEFAEFRLPFEIEKLFPARAFNSRYVAEPVNTSRNVPTSLASKARQ